METQALKPQKKHDLNFQFCFAPIADFILYLCSSLSSETWSEVWTYFSVIACFLMLCSKRRFSNPAIQNSGSNQNWYRTNLKNAIFWYTLTVPVSCQFVKSAITNFIHPSFQLHILKVHIHLHLWRARSNLGIFYMSQLWSW